MQTVLEHMHTINSERRSCNLWQQAPGTHQDVPRHPNATPQLRYRHSQNRARLTVYWPNIDSDIENVIATKCAKYARTYFHPTLGSQPSSSPKPTRPFQEFARDFCSYTGKNYLVLVDCFSDWLDIIPTGHNTSTPRLTKALRGSFCSNRVPCSDQGPQFPSKLFKEFAKLWGSWILRWLLLALPPSAP